MDQTPYKLDAGRRELVLKAIIEVRSHRGWTLFTAHVRTNHVHAVVGADVRPETVMNCFKSYASRALNRFGLDPVNRKRWTRHGSTRYLWNEEELPAAIAYVIEGQGEPMQVFEISAP
jgi:REP element-mobilizing transposase RayT